MTNSLAKKNKYTRDALKWFSMLPEYKPCRKGLFSIQRETKPNGTSVPVVSMRNALLEGTGIPICDHVLEEDTAFFKLCQKGQGVWMTTALQELGQMTVPLKAARGNVLIGGLGLGAIAHLMQQQPKVKSVEVVELEKDIIDLVRPFISPAISIIHNDLFEHLKSLPDRNQYDFGFFDTWQSTEEWTWQTLVVPLRRLARKRVRKVICWQENEMQGQIWQGAARYACFETEELKGRAATTHRWVFNKTLEHWMPEIKKTSMKNMKLEDQKWFAQSFELQAKPEFRHFVSIFMDVSYKHWESIFGKLWDESLAWYKKDDEETDVT